MAHISSSTSGYYIMADQYTGTELDFLAGPFRTKEEADSALAIQYPNHPEPDDYISNLAREALVEWEAWTTPDANSHVASLDLAAWSGRAATVLAEFVREHADGKCGFKPPF